MKKTAVLIFLNLLSIVACNAETELPIKFTSSTTQAMTAGKQLVAIDGWVTVEKFIEEIPAEVCFVIDNNDKQPLRISSLDSLKYVTKDKTVFEIDLIEARYNKKIVNPSGNAVINVKIKEDAILLDQLNKNEVLIFIYSPFGSQIMISAGNIDKAVQTS